MYVYVVYVYSFYNLCIKLRDSKLIVCYKIRRFSLLRMKAYLANKLCIITYMINSMWINM